MTKRLTAEDPCLPTGRGGTHCIVSATGVIVLGIDFRSKRRERIYDADKIWSGEHSILDYTEL